MPTPPKHKSRGLFSRIKRFVDDHPYASIAIAVGISAAFIAVSVVTLGASAIAAGSVLGAVAIGSAATIYSAGLANVIAGTIVGGTEEKEKDAKQVKRGNGDGQNVQDYVIVNGKRFGESRSPEHTQTRFDYVMANNLLQEKIDSISSHQISQDQLTMMDLREKLNTAMTAYETAGKKNRDQALADLQGVIKEAQNIANSVKAPPPSIHTSTAAVAQSMGGATVKSHLEILHGLVNTAPDATVAPKPTMTVGDVIKTLSHDFGPTANDNHARVRTGFAGRLTKLEACIKENPGDTSLTDLRGKMDQVMKDFEVGYKKALAAGDRTMAEPVAAALRQMYTTVDDTLASKAPTVESAKEDKPTLSH